MANSSNSTLLFGGLAKATIPSNYLYIGLGILGSMSSSTLIFVLLRSKRKKTNFTNNMLHLAVADLFLEISAIIVGAKRYTSAISCKYPTKLLCSIEIFIWNSAVIAGIVQTFCLAFDRLLSASIPSTYHSHLRGPKMQLINLSQWLVVCGCCLLGPLKYQRPLEIIPTCAGTVIYTSGYAQAFMYLILAYTIATVAAYVAILIIVKVRLTAVANRHGDIKNVKKQLETKVLASVGLVIFVYCATWLIASVGIQLVLQLLPADIANLLVPYIATAVVTNGTLNCAIYLWKNESVRKDFANVFCKKQTSTVDIQIQITPPSVSKLNRQSAWD